jgi:DNA-binding CsgD family transcriptional regulator
MSIYLKREDRLLGVFSLFRPLRAPSFSSLEQTKADLIAPYLTSSFEKTLISETMSERDSIIDSLVTELPYKGVMVLDASLELIYINESAVSIMSNLNQAEGGRQISFGLLPKEIYLRCKDFLRSAKLNETFLPHQHQFDFISPGDNVKISIHLRQITYRDKSPLLLLCFDPEENLLCLFKKLGERGLTRREIDVVLLLSKGLKNKDIGEKLFISEYTVENHLRSIYRKMDVNNRTEVAHRLIQMFLRKE